MNARVMLKALAACCLAAGLSFTASAEEKAGNTALYELRTYHAEPDKLDALLSRFRDHTCKLFEKHGMTNVAYFVPVENKDNLLVYLLSYPDKAARDASWKGFLADPEWKKAAGASEVNGKLVGKIDELFLSPTDFSPVFGNGKPGGPDRLFEMRTYTATPGKLSDLHKRFRDHTMELFKKHGMTYLGFYKLTEFRADPVWVAAKKASEDAAGGSLTVPDGVKSVFLRPMDFSPVK